MLLSLFKLRQFLRLVEPSNDRFNCSFGQRSFNRTDQHDIRRPARVDLG